MTTSVERLPQHLRKYIVPQDYDQYTAIDQAVWRFCLRQLRDYFSTHAPAGYVDGLQNTGITIEAIPRIEAMDAQLQAIGWGAVPVSGFIPPPAFMELQAMGILPIGTVMRTLEHLLYTPAPDIIHEAAGHAPILADATYSKYLHAYGQVAKKAIFHTEDLEQYEAIRVLSDLKEDPNASADAIAAAERHLRNVTAAMGEPSEAAMLGRMHWWTTEYGLLGDLQDPKIYGAGLLSSVAEAKSCLRPAVQKLPMSIACTQQAYDITEPQPQLFVTPDYQRLSAVLEEFAGTMAFRRGGVFGIARAQAAQTVNTVEYRSGLQVSGRLTAYQTDVASTEAQYLQFTGPVQLCYRDEELPGHGTSRHAEGFGAPVGYLVGANKCLSDCSPAELEVRGIHVGKVVQLEFQSGVVVEGMLKALLQRDHKILVLTFAQCTVTHAGRTLFQPAWGEYDMAVGASVSSVCGGPADRERYGEVDDFVAKRVPPHVFSAAERRLTELYTQVRQLREHPQADQERRLHAVATALDVEFPRDWLLRIELLELACGLVPQPAWLAALRRQLRTLAEQDVTLADPIREGMRLAEAEATPHSRVA